MPSVQVERGDAQSVRARRRTGDRRVRPRSSASCGRRAGRRCAGCSTPACACSPSAATTPPAVDDIVRAARTSHGTFYLYFANKEDLLRRAGRRVRRGDDRARRPHRSDHARRRRGSAELRVVPRRVLRDVPPLRARSSGPGWRTRSRTATSTGWASRRSPRSRPAWVSACAKSRRRHHRQRDGCRRCAHGNARALQLRVVSRRLILDDDAVLDTLAHIIHRGFFGAPAR